MKLHEILRSLSPEMRLSDGANTWTVKELIKAMSDSEAWAKCGTCGVDHNESEYILGAPSVAIYKLRGGFRDPKPVYVED